MLIPETAARHPADMPIPVGETAVQFNARTTDDPIGRFENEGGRLPTVSGPAGEPFCA